MEKAATKDTLKEEKRRLILEAALHVFAERGFDKATVDEVAERAGVSKGTIYLYYKNKDALFFSLLDGKMEEIGQAIARAIRGAASLPGLVRDVVTAELGYLESNKEFFRIFSSEQVRFDMDFQSEFRRMLRKRMNAYIDDLASALQRFLPAGTEKDVARDLALSLIGTMSGHTTDWIINHDARPLTRKIDFIVDLFLAGVEKTVAKRSSAGASVATLTDDARGDA